MNFGTVIADEDGGLVSLKPDGVIIVQGALVADREKVDPASFSLYGTNSQAYTISLPKAATFVKGAGTIRVKGFVHNAGDTPRMGLDGNSNFNIGATLFLEKRQSAGFYSGSLVVTISNN